MQFLNYFILFFALLETNHSVVFKNVPMSRFFRKDYNYIKSLKSFYKIHTIHRTWADAKLMCTLEGATLFYGENFLEVSKVLSLWNATLPLLTMIVGISDDVVTGVYETVDGLPLSNVYNKWEPGEPKGCGEERHCIAMYPNAILHEESCSQKFPFVCKKKLESVKWNDKCNMPNLEYKYNKVLERCYKIHLKPSNWTYAYAVCSAEQSYLAVINSNEEAEYLVGLTATAPRHRVKGNFTRGSVLLGFHNRNDEGWQTIKGTAIEESGYVRWSYSQPNGGDRERCGAMFYNGYLNDIGCHRKCFFICEHELDNDFLKEDDIAKYE